MSSTTWQKGPYVCSTLADNWKYSNSDNRFISVMCNMDEQKSETPKKLKMCINTQTPLVWFIPDSMNVASINGKSTDLSQLTEGVDYNYSSGGVTRMVFPLIKHMLGDGTLAEAYWVSLNQSGPETIKIGGVNHHFVSLKKDQLVNYGNVKETMWRAAHGTTTDTNAAADMFMSGDFPDYTYYNRLTAEMTDTCLRLQLPNHNC